MIYLFIDSNSPQWKMEQSKFPLYIYMHIHKHKIHKWENKKMRAIHKWENKTMRSIQKYYKLQI